MHFFTMVQDTVHVSKYTIILHFSLYKCFILDLLMVTLQEVSCWQDLTTALEVPAVQEMVSRDHVDCPMDMGGG